MESSQLDATASRRLGRLVASVRRRIDAGEGKDATRNAVLAFAKLPNLTALADAVAVNRSALSAMLHNITPQRRVRERLEECLGIPPGGMARVLAVQEEENHGS